MSQQQPDGQQGTPSGPPPDFPPPLYGGPPPAGQPQPYAQPAPYGQPQPYAQPAPYYGPYPGSPQPPGWGTPPYGGYPQPAPTPGSSIALVVVSGFFVLFFLIGVPSLIIGIIALTKARFDPAEAKRLTWIGWLVLGVIVAVLVLIGVILLAATASDWSSSPDDGTTIGALGTTLPPLALRST